MCETCSTAENWEKGRCYQREGNIQLQRWDGKLDDDMGIWGSSLDVASDLTTRATVQLNGTSATLLSSAAKGFESFPSVNE